MRPRHTMLRAALGGMALGAAWGVLARIWMRLVTDAPEFSWTGTMLIIGLAATHGVATGVAAGALRAGRGGWWRLVSVPGLLLFAGQGLLFLPGVLVGSVALARRSRAGLVVAVLASLVVPVALWRALRLDETTMLPASVTAQASTLVGMPLLTLGLAWWNRDLFVRRPAGVVAGQSGSPDLALSSRLSDSSLEAPAGPA